MLVTVRERFDRWLLDPQLRRGVIINVRNGVGFVMVRYYCVTLGRSLMIVGVRERGVIGCKYG
jgi:hypothetical protein